jgi:hypothetical protein
MRTLLRTWARKHQAGELAGGRPTMPDRRVYEAKIVSLERKVGQLTIIYGPPDIDQRRSTLLER